jgi:DNA-binding MarR family transcriptional regulator
MQAHSGRQCFEAAMAQFVRGVYLSNSNGRFTDRQGQYLAFIYAYSRVNGRPPAEVDMQRYFQVSAATVHQAVVDLARAGFIWRQRRMARSIEVMVAPESLPALR